MGCGSAKISSSTARNPSSPSGKASLGYGEQEADSSPATTHPHPPPYRLINSHSEFSTTTAISGNARIRVTLSGDGSLLEIETERFLEDEEEQSLFNQRISPESCPGCSPDQPSTSNCDPVHTCYYKDLADTFIYHRHILDNSLSVSQTKAIHSSLPDFRRLHNSSDLVAMCTGNQYGQRPPTSRTAIDHACQTWDLPHFPVEQLPASPRPLRPRLKPCTAAKGYTCLEYCAKECYKHATSIQRTDSTLVGGVLPQIKQSSVPTGKKAFGLSSSSRRKGGIVKRSRTFDVPPDGGVISPATVPLLPAAHVVTNNAYHVKRSSTFDGSIECEQQLPNGHVVRAHTYDDVKRTVARDSSSQPSFLASLTNRNKVNRDASETSYSGRLKRFSRQNSVQSACLSRENSEQSQSTKSSLLSRQASAQSASSPDSEHTLSIETKLRRRLRGWGNKTLPEVVNNAVPPPGNTGKYSTGQHGRKGPVLKTQSEDLVDEGLDLGLSELTVHQDFYNDFGDIFDEDNLQS